MQVLCIPDRVQTESRVCTNPQVPIAVSRKVQNEISSMLVLPAGGRIFPADAESALHSETQAFDQVLSYLDLKPVLVVQGEVATCCLDKESKVLLGSVFATTCCK